MGGHKPACILGDLHDTELLSPLLETNCREIAGTESGKHFALMKDLSHSVGNKAVLGEIPADRTDPSCAALCGTDQYCMGRV